MLFIFNNDIFSTIVLLYTSPARKSHLNQLKVVSSWPLVGSGQFQIQVESRESRELINHVQMLNHLKQVSRVCIKIKLSTGLLKSYNYSSSGQNLDSLTSFSLQIQVKVEPQERGMEKFCAGVQFHLTCYRSVQQPRLIMSCRYCLNGNQNQINYSICEQL